MGTKGAYFSLYATEEGMGAVVTTDLGVTEVMMPEDVTPERMRAAVRDRFPGAGEGSPLSQRAAELLARYFRGEAVDFDVPLDDSRWTPFQREIYRVVRAIPFGAVMSYGEVARTAGRPGAARGVGSAMARNPLPVIIPCHRVIGSTGKMTGYSAPGGVARKEMLLRMEKEV
jgi:methylated-DNA-[protein]-cysteine S-methyltransferase